MTPHEFVAKWGPRGTAYRLNERAGAQLHFVDLCHVLNVPTPSDRDSYCFEAGVEKTGDGKGYADVWKRGCFAWEYKAPGGDLAKALRQLMLYALPLENPPLLIVSDRQRIEIHTHFTGYPSQKHIYAQQDLSSPEMLSNLRAAFDEPDRFRPRQTSLEITTAAAGEFALIADRMRDSGTSATAAAHFLTQCLFCLFAEDVGLLPDRLFERLLRSKGSAAEIRSKLVSLFGSMRDGGPFGAEDISWFNGGLFRDHEVPSLVDMDLEALRSASKLDWSALDAGILGTLFERGLEPSKRRQLGAHYTDPATIRKVIDPVIATPLRARWAEERKLIAGVMYQSKRRGDGAWKTARNQYLTFLETLRAFRILDPACGSGNFLYLGLKALKDFEHQVNTDAHAMGIDRELDLVTGPHNVLGIEVSEFAAELSRVTVWIGELQWRIAHGYSFKENPVLEPLDHIECRDALIDQSGAEAAWPASTVIIGNPPFLGTKKQWKELGVSRSTALRTSYAERVPGFADLVCYWFEKAAGQIRGDGACAAALVATNSIRTGANRFVLDEIVKNLEIFEAWSDEPWVNEGAAVRVSILAFARPSNERQKLLNGKVVASIHTDLSSGVDLTRANKLRENEECAFIGTVKAGKFDVDGNLARTWLQEPNPYGRSNSAVVRRSANGIDLVRRPTDTWVVDFGVDMTQEEARLFAGPFAHVEKYVKPARKHNNGKAERERWWLMARPVPMMRSKIRPLPRYIATPAVSKHRVFVWLDASVLPDHAVVVVARADDTTFGVLHSRMHELWSLGLCSSLEDRPRYTPTTTFETFPFPAGLAPAGLAGTVIDRSGAALPQELNPELQASARSIAVAAHALDRLRNGWLNPPEWTEQIGETAPVGLSARVNPPRTVAKPAFESALAKRTMTALYNDRPSWLVEAHRKLDAAVAVAYGWDDYVPTMSDQEILGRLLSLNLERSRLQAGGQRELALTAVLSNQTGKVKAKRASPGPKTAQSA